MHEQSRLVRSTAMALLHLLRAACLAYASGPDLVYNGGVGVQPREVGEQCEQRRRFHAHQILQRSCANEGEDRDERARRLAVKTRERLVGAIGQTRRVGMAVRVRMRVDVRTVGRGGVGVGGGKGKEMGEGVVEGESEEDSVGECEDES